MQQRTLTPMSRGASSRKRSISASRAGLVSARPQEWALEKFVEARYLRVVGTCSAIAGGGTKLARRETIIRADSMGFLSVSFH